MDIERLQEYFEKAFEDGRVSRSERRALRAVLEDSDPPEAARRELLAGVFDLTRRTLSSAADQAALDGLETAVKLLLPRRPAPRNQVYFAPRHNCSQHLCRLLDESSRSVEICVFTVTHDAISSAILRAFQRGVAVRIVTDDEKIHDRGSDVIELARDGVPVRMDDSSDHMHHKFAIFDHRIVVTGSYNWTRSAAKHNQENLVSIGDPRLVTAFSEEFERLWTTFARGS